MVIYLGADHGGFNLKETLKEYLKGKGYEVVDCGAATYDESDDYPDFAAAVALRVKSDPERGRGVLICKSGAGMDMAANRFRHVRAFIGFSADQVFDARHDDDANVLCLAASFISEPDARQMVDAFLQTPFEREERFLRRLDKIAQIEDQQ